MRHALAFSLTAAFVFAPTGASHAMGVDELVARNIEARGGLAKLRAQHSMRLTGKVVFGGGGGRIEGAFGLVQKRDNKLRQEFTLQGLTQVTAYDGREGWSLDPFEGRREAERMSADDTKQVAQDADFDGPLVDWKQKGHRVEYLGTEDVDGTRAHKLRLTRKDGDIEYIFLDPDAFLEIRTVEIHRVRGTEHISENDYGNYEQVAGTWIAFSVDSGAKGRPRSSHLTIEKVEVNVAVDDAVFKFPSAGASLGRVAIPGPNASAPAPARPPVQASEQPPTVDSGVISGLRARNIGSAAMSGRISAIAGKNEGGKTVLYVGAASGGVWRSLDGGTTFKPVFDKQPVQSIGAIAIDPQNSKSIWVGAGESWTRNSVSIGDGIYKSTDGGENWTNMGLRSSERITRIIVHPRNSQIVYACVPGKLWSDSPDRGLYKTTDGGKTWALVLKGANPSTGCSGLAMDPGKPDVLFAGMWDFRRKGWTFRSGGPTPDSPSQSGLFRTTDGGRSWQPLTTGSAKGLPKPPWGRVEVAIAPSDPKIVYAFIESKDSALFRSDDGGATWQERDKSQNMVWRPFYFARLVIDPTRPDHLFKPDLNLIVSEDGGRSFSQTGGGAHGDWHDVWIDPDNPKHVVGGDDGGLWLSWDGGNRWWKGANLPVSQFYHVSVDSKDPYQVYGGLQDNSSWVGDSSYPGGISNQRWENLYGGDGFWVVVDPTDPEHVYAESQGGYIGRTNRRTLAARDIQPKAGYKEKLRFNWNAPIHASPTQKGTLYLGAQFLFRSRDHGDTWQRISPDLTSNDKEKQKQEESGGVTVDNSVAEMHCTIYSISESPRDARVIWVGTDDGNLQLSRDGGKSWTKVAGNVPGLPKESWVSWVEASRFAPGTAYAAFDRHTFGDMNPWVFRTTDFGKTWKRVVAPEQGVRGYAHVIKEDTQKPAILFVGTELGLWISIDGGASWAEFKGGDFPSVAVRDLQVHPREHDLVLATHGRGIWIIDDLTPLRSLSTEVLQKSFTFLPGRPVQQRMPARGGWPEGDAGFAGENPPAGAVVTYYRRSRHIYGPLKLEVLDAQGKLVDDISVSKRRGINRVDWSMQVKPPRVPRAAQVAFGAAHGPRVVPGTYTLRLTDGADVIESKLKVGLDVRARYGVAERKAQFEAVMRAHALFGEMSDLIDRIEAARAAAGARAKALPAGDELTQKLRALGGKLEDVRKKIVATKEGGAITGEERLREHLDILYGALMAWEGRPARYQLDRIEVLRHELRDVVGEFDAIATQMVRPLDEELRRHKLAPIPTEKPPSAKAAAPPTGAALAAAIRCLRTRGAECASEAATAQTADTR